MNESCAKLSLRRSRAEDTRQDQAGDQPEVLEETVERHEAIMTRERPEIVGRQHCNCREHAEPTGTQPNPAPEDHQYGTCELDDNCRGGPEPSGFKAEMG